LQRHRNPPFQVPSHAPVSQIVFQPKFCLSFRIVRPRLNQVALKKPFVESLFELRIGLKVEKQVFSGLNSGRLFTNRTLNVINLIFRGLKHFITRITLISFGKSMTGLTIADHKPISQKHGTTGTVQLFDFLLHKKTILVTFHKNLLHHFCMNWTACTTEVVV
jgi:hypothetical protein